MKNQRYLKTQPKNIVRSDFFPSIAQIKKEITLLKTPMLNDSTDSEWEKVIELIRSYKFNDHLNSLNPIKIKLIKQENGNEYCFDNVHEVYKFINKSVGGSYKDFINTNKPHLGYYWFDI